MRLTAWERLPAEMQREAVRPYYDILSRKKAALFAKRAFDLAASCVLLVLLSPVLAVLSVWVKLDSEGSVMYRQERVTQYGRVFRIFKFRTMVQNADKIGSLVTTDHDPRVTRSGRFLRKFRLDELPQLLNVITGDMSFVGTRPEVKKYVDCYTDEMMATLLLPVGITSEASIRYKDEAALLDAAEDVDKTYVETVLPGKMAYNLQAIRDFGLLKEIKLLFRTVAAVLGKPENPAR